MATEGKLLPEQKSVCGCALFISICLTYGYSQISKGPRKMLSNRDGKAASHFFEGG